MKGLRAASIRNTLAKIIHDNPARNEETMLSPLILTKLKMIERANSISKIKKSKSAIVFVQLLHYVFPLKERVKLIYFFLFFV